MKIHLDKRTMLTYPPIESVAAALGGAKLLRERVRTVADLSRLVAAGLPFESLRRVGARYPGAERARVEQLVVPRTTMLRREQEGVLSVEESQRLERIARLTTLAEQVLESPQAGIAFLLAPHPLLDGKPPIELAVTDLGARRVEELLWRLEYSLPV